MRNRPFSRRRANSQIRRAALEMLEDRQLMALTVTPFNPGSASTLTNALLVSNTGITVSNSSYVGSAGQGGTYSGFSFASGSTTLNLPNGVVLTSGLANNALPPNDEDGDGSTIGTSGDGDADLTKLIRVDDQDDTETEDANSLTLTFTTSASTKSILFDFVFGSEEFPEFVGLYNDAFAAYLDGVQISFDSDKKPITVNNNFFTLNNSGITDPADEPAVAGKTPVDLAIQYDGLTPRITTQAPLNASKTTHTLKLVIADTGDSILDSAVFLASLRGSNQAVGEATTGQPPTTDAGGPYTVPAGGQVGLTGTGSDPDQSAASLKFAWDLDGDGVFGETGAAAANGTENVKNPTFKATGLAGGTSKTVTLKVTDSDGLFATDTATVNITSVTQPALSVSAGGPYTINEGASLSLNATATNLPSGVTGTYSWDVNGDGTYGDATGKSPTLSWTQLKALGITDGNASSTYQLKVRLTPSTGAAVVSPATTFKVNNVAPTANAGADKSVKEKTAVTLTGSATDPAGDADPLTYSWVVVRNGSTVATGSGKSFTFTPSVAGTYTATLTVSDGDGGTKTDSAIVTATPVTTGPFGTVTSFVLVDAEHDKDIKTLTNGETINLATLPSRKLSIRVITSPDKVGSVVLDYDGATKFRIENTAPYTLFANLGSDTFAGTLTLGSHSLLATPFSNKNGAGTAGGALGLNFNVIDTQVSAPSVGSFVLVNSDTEQDIKTLKDGDTIKLSDLPANLNVRAVVNGNVQSVRFGLNNNPNWRLELGAPWSLFGDYPSGNFNKGDIKPGTYKITATPYAGPNGTGAVGTPLTITITVIA